MKCLTPHDDVVDATELEKPEEAPKIAVLPAPARFAIASEADAGAAHWDNPGMAPYALYDIAEPGARGRGAPGRAEGLRMMRH